MEHRLRSSERYTWLDHKKYRVVILSNTRGEYATCLECEDGNFYASWHTHSYGVALAHWNGRLDGLKRGGPICYSDC